LGVYVAAGFAGFGAADFLLVRFRAAAFGVAFFFFMQRTLQQRQKYGQ
jgi:hypothetical protein